MGKRVRLHIPVVVFASPNIPSFGLNAKSDHIINETMFVPEFAGLKLFSVVLLVDLLEDILEPAVILLQNGVLGAHVQRHAALESVAERGVREI